MKIGEAGEAFFIFETAGDVPDELITSPLLEATRSPDIHGRDAQTGRFGANEGDDQGVENLEQLPQSEPDFLDLNAPSPPPASGQTEPTSVSQVERDDEQDAVGPSSLLDRAATLGASIGNTLLEKERDEYLKAKERTKALYHTSQQIVRHTTTDPDDVSPSRQPESMPAEPIYNDGVQNTFISHYRPLTHSKDAVLDMEGYHSHHKKEQSDQTVTATSERESTPSPSSPDLTPGPSSMLCHVTFCSTAPLTLEIIQGQLLHLSMGPALLLQQYTTSVSPSPLCAPPRSHLRTWKRKTNPPPLFLVIPGIYPVL